jgi:hypothetical protein
MFSFGTDISVGTTERVDEAGRSDSETAVGIGADAFPDRIARKMNRSARAVPKYGKKRDIFKG